MSTSAAASISMMEDDCVAPDDPAAVVPTINGTTRTSTPKGAIPVAITTTTSRRTSKLKKSKPNKSCSPNSTTTCITSTSANTSKPNTIKPPNTTNTATTKQPSKKKAMAPDILQAAATRWLNVSEILYLLSSEQRLLTLNSSPPDDPPSSGTLLLYDRNLTRNYKADKHLWIKKRNSPKVREDHVKLRVKGVNKVAGCYVHGAQISTLHRRAYHLIHTNITESSDNNTNTTAAAAAAPNMNANIAPMPVLQLLHHQGHQGHGPLNRNEANLVVVHYLDTDCAAAVSAQLAAQMTMTSASGADVALLSSEESQSMNSKPNKPSRRHKQQPQLQLSATQTAATCDTISSNRTLATHKVASQHVNVNANVQPQPDPQPQPPQGQHQHHDHGQHQHQDEYPHPQAVHHYLDHEEPPPLPPLMPTNNNHSHYYYDEYPSQTQAQTQAQAQTPSHEFHPYSYPPHPHPQPPQYTHAARQSPSESAMPMPMLHQHHAPSQDQDQHQDASVSLDTPMIMSMPMHSPEKSISMHSPNDNGGSSTATATATATAVPHMGSLSSAFNSPIMTSSNAGPHHNAGPHEDDYANANAHHHQEPTLSMLDVEALDELWSQIMDEEANQFDGEIMQAASHAIDEHLNDEVTHDLVQSIEHAMLQQAQVQAYTNSNHTIHHMEAHAQGQGQQQAQGEDQIMLSTLDHHLPQALEAKLAETMENQLRGKQLRLHEKHYHGNSHGNVVHGSSSSGVDVPVIPFPVVPQQQHEAEAEAEAPISDPHVPVLWLDHDPTEDDVHAPHDERYNNAPRNDLNRMASASMSPSQQQVQVVEMRRDQQNGLLPTTSQDQEPHHHELYDYNDNTRTHPTNSNNHPSASQQQDSAEQDHNTNNMMMEVTVGLGGGSADDASAVSEFSNMTTTASYSKTTTTTANSTTNNGNTGSASKTDLIGQVKRTMSLPLPEIVDFTPEQVTLALLPGGTTTFTSNRKPTKLVCSLSSPLLDLPPCCEDDDESGGLGLGVSFRWTSYVAFVTLTAGAEPLRRRGRGSTEHNTVRDAWVGDVALSPMQMLSPFSYKCQVPTTIIQPGGKFLMAVSVKTPVVSTSHSHGSGSDKAAADDMMFDLNSSSNKLADAVKISLQAAWNKELGTVGNGTLVGLGQHDGTGMSRPYLFSQQCHDYSYSGAEEPKENTNTNTSTSDTDTVLLRTQLSQASFEFLGVAAGPRPPAAAAAAPFVASTAVPAPTGSSDGLFVNSVNTSSDFAAPFMATVAEAMIDPLGYDCHPAAAAAISNSADADAAFDPAHTALLQPCPFASSSADTSTVSTARTTAITTQTWIDGDSVRRLEKRRPKRTAEIDVDTTTGTTDTGGTTGGVLVQQDDDLVQRHCKIRLMERLYQINTHHEQYNHNTCSTGGTIVAEQHYHQNEGEHGHGQHEITMNEQGTAIGANQHDPLSDDSRGITRDTCTSSDIVIDTEFDTDITVDVDVVAVARLDVVDTTEDDTAEEHVMMKLLLSDEELFSMDNDALDEMLDGLLIKFVETLIDTDICTDSTGTTDCYGQQEEEDEAANYVTSEVNKTGFSGFTLLHYAALYNLLSLVPLLISRGADPNTTSEKGGLTPLHMACGAGNMAIVQVLVKHGSDLLAQDSSGFTPVRHARRNGYPTIVQWLMVQQMEHPQQQQQNQSRSELSDHDSSGSDSASHCKTGTVTGADGESMYAAGSSTAVLGSGSGIGGPSTMDHHHDQGDDDDDDEDHDKETIVKAAFSNLSLKDKLGVNYFMKRKSENNIIMEEQCLKNIEPQDESQSRTSIRMDGDGDGDAVVVNEREEPTTGTASPTTTRSTATAATHKNTSTGNGNASNANTKTTNKTNHSKSNRFDNLFDKGVVVSDTERQNLDTAMNLMSEGECDFMMDYYEMHDDARSWMLRRNYAAMREALQTQTTHRQEAQKKKQRATAAASVAFQQKHHNNLNHKQGLLAISADHVHHSNTNGHAHGGSAIMSIANLNTNTTALVRGGGSVDTNMNMELLQDTTDTAMSTSDPSPMGCRGSITSTTSHVRPIRSGYASAITSSSSNMMSHSHPDIHMNTSNKAAVMGHRASSTTKSSTKSKLSQALAMLVLRKNMIDISPTTRTITTTTRTGTHTTKPAPNNTPAPTDRHYVNPPHSSV